MGKSENYQFTLFSHTELLVEKLENLPDFGEGDRCCVADNGVKTVIIDHIVSVKGKTMYECHTDDDAPIQGCYYVEELFHLSEIKECKKRWDIIRDYYAAFTPKSETMDKEYSFGMILPRPWRGKRVHRILLAVMPDGSLYIDSPFVHLVSDRPEDPFKEIERIKDEIYKSAEIMKGKIIENTDNQYKELYLVNDRYVLYDRLLAEDSTNLRNLRSKIA